MSSIISQINWISNGERASSTVLNRPLLEFLAKYETGEIELNSRNNGIDIDPSIIDSSVSDGDLVSYDTTSKKLVQTELSNIGFFAGIIDVTHTKLYIDGFVSTDLFSYSLSNATKYYVDYSNAGKMSSVRSDNAPYIGFTITTDSPTGSQMFLDFSANHVVEEIEANGGVIDGGTYPSTHDEIGTINGGAY